MPKKTREVALHSIPLFEGSQTIHWQEDGRTNQLNRLVLAINHGVDGQGKIKYNKINDIIYDIQQIWIRAQLPLPASNNLDGFYSIYWPLLKEAIAKHAEYEGLVYKASDLDEDVSDGWVKLQFFKKSLQDALIIEDGVNDEEELIKVLNGDLERITDSHNVLQTALAINTQKKKVTSEIIHRSLSATSISVQPSLTEPPSLGGLSSEPLPCPTSLVTSLPSKPAIPSFMVGRLFVGCGYAGMTLMTTDPSVSKAAVKAFEQLQNYVSLGLGSAPLYLETLLISEQETGHWTKADHRAEQEHPLLEVPGNSTANDFVPKSQFLSRSVRTNTRHLFYANTVNMALKDTPPPLYGVSVEKLETRAKHPDDWNVQAISYNYRLKVSIANGSSTITAYIYAQLIDFSLGMGVGQNTAFEDALQYEFVRNSNALEISSAMGKNLYKQFSTFDQEKGFTPILHGNEYDLSPRESQLTRDVKTRRVVVIGGAGGTATAYRIAVLGKDSDGYRLLSESGELLGDSSDLCQNPNVKIFARGKVTYTNLALQATESFEHARAKKNLFENYLLLGINQTKAGEIVLRFHKREGAREIEKTLALHFKEMMKNPGRHSRRVIPEVVEDNGKFFILNPHVEICEQLIAGMGQDASKLRTLILSEVDESELRTVRGRDGHIVALTTVSGQIRLNGAMAGNITRKFTEDLSASLKKSNLPRNSNDQNIMPCVLSKFFSFFASRSEELKPRRVSVNVNTCFLQRGDLRKDKTEFHEFLEHAELTSSEIVDFVQFLQNERATDLSGAGVSFEKLTNYLKTAGIDDQVQIVSACTLIATKDLRSCLRYD